MELRLTMAAIVAAVAMSASAALPAVDNFEISEVYKTSAMNFKVADGQGGNVYVSTRVSMQWPTKFGNNDIKALQDSLIGCAFNGRFGSPDEAIADFVSHPAGYTDYAMKAVDEIPDDSTLQVWQQCLDVWTVGFCDRYIVYRLDYLVDYGGAHPNRYSRFLNYDIANNSVLNFSDIFRPGTDSTLLAAVHHALQLKYFAPDDSTLAANSGIFPDQLTVSRNVLLDGDGITFHYNPYDIAPWSAGAISVTIPAWVLSRELSPRVRELYGLDAYGQ